MRLVRDCLVYLTLSGGQMFGLLLPFLASCLIDSFGLLEFTHNSKHYHYDNNSNNNNNKKATTKLAA